MKVRKLRGTVTSPGSGVYPIDLNLIYAPDGEIEVHLRGATLQPGDEVHIEFTVAEIIDG